MGNRTVRDALVTVNARRTETWTNFGPSNDFWLQGVDHFERVLDPDCLMALPAPAGIMDRQAIIESLSGVPRWTDLTMSNQRITTPASGFAVMAYEAAARRDGQSPYRAVCLSTYRHDGQRWLMTSHQQTPDT